MARIGGEEEADQERKRGKEGEVGVGGGKS